MLTCGFPLKLFRITGDSMSPYVHDGDYVVSHTLWRNLHEGDVVVVQHPELGVVVKRVLRSIRGGVFLQGDNATVSTSTERMGLISYNEVLGRVCYRIRHP